MDALFDLFKNYRDEQMKPSKEDVILSSTASITKFIIICIHLCLVALAIYLFNVEEHLGLPTLMPLVIGAFIVNALIPKSYRLTFFFFVSLIPIFYSFGWIQGGLLILYALLMIGTCHLPISISLRRLGVLVLAGGLAYGQHLLFETGFIAGHAISSQIISLLGVMFMFRMIIYLYELKFEKEKISIWQRLSYFFMLPNICFPIFPVVDFKTYKLTYYNDNDLTIYRRGLNLIILGFVQLLCYRVLYYLTPSANNASGFWQLVTFLTFSYLMLIRLNGMLNIAVGLLRLFGFNLPNIFNFMFLAQGFDDYWRRLNIYWKDFMVKIFYYPVYFKLRKKNITLALTLATIVTFVFNWTLHSYQWFWILGRFSIRSTEILVWSSLCVFVLAAILKQHNSKSRVNRLEEDDRLWLLAFKKSTSVVYTFVVMIFIYSLYMSSSVKAWMKLISLLSIGSIVDWLNLLLLALMLLLVGAVLFMFHQKGGISYVYSYFKQSKNMVVFQCSLLGIAILSTSTYANQFVKEKTNYSLSTFINHELNSSDKSQQSKGYYEELLLSDNFSSPLWQMESKRPRSWKRFSKTGGEIKTGLLESLKPNIDITFKRANVRSNKWGLRDKEYTKQRPENIVRMAIVGGSLEMGSGVNNDEIFENIIENKLNEDYGSDSQGFELLNFAVPGLSSIKNVEKIYNHVLDFEPQYVIVCVHNEEILHFQKTLRWISEVQKSRSKIKKIRSQSPWFIDFEKFLNDEGIVFDRSKSDQQNYQEGLKIMNWTYDRMQKITSEQNSQMMMVFMPDTNGEKQNLGVFQTIAKRIGVPIFDQSEVFQAYSSEDLSIAPWDRHPNTKGHQLIADQLYLDLVDYLKLNKKD